MTRQEEQALRQERAALERFQSQLSLLRVEIEEQRAFYFHNGLEQTVGQAPTRWMSEALTRLSSASDYIGLRLSVLSDGQEETLEDKERADWQQAGRDEYEEVL